MKVTLFLSALWLYIASFFAPATSTVLTGNITDGTEPLIGATVKVMRGTEFVRGSITDYNGDYRIQLDPGTYDLECSYTGFKPVRIIGVQVFAGKITIQNIVFSNATTLNEVEISSYKVPLIEKDQTSSGQTLTDDQIKALPTRDVKPIEATTVGASSSESAKKEKPGSAAEAKGKMAAKPAAGSSPAPAVKDDGEINILGAKEKGTDYYIDGIRVSGGVPPVTDIEDLKVVTGKLPEALGMPAGSGIIKVDAKRASGVEEEISTFEIEDKAPIGIEDAAPPSGTPAVPAPRAGLLTAGEWNDLHNWNNHWVDLLTDGETDAYQTMYGFYPRQRYAVWLTNENEVPIPDAVAQLKSADGKVLWEARTDNTGKAELWAGLFTPEKETAKLHAELWVNGNKHEIKSLKPAEKGFNHLKVNAECNAPKNVDILWAVDATGSMGDEIEYLKTELLDVIGRAKSRNPELEYRMGTVFYRDHGDEYLTRTSPLSTDILQTVQFIQKQYAGGGGDYPEAVHSALEEAIFNQKWSENAIARICFLVLDASPHQGDTINASLQKSIREAARLGIRIVPIAASGIQKDTEFLMKFFGLATNGSYVFLTDHSGIGGKHLEPTTDEYKVEPLNNLLVRLITEYSSIQTCEGKSEIRFENDPQQQPGPTMQALYYPNPAVDQFTLELPYAVQSVTIYDAEGKSVRKLEKPVAGANVIQIQGLAAGFYTIRILNNGLMQSGKLMVVRS